MINLKILAISKSKKSALCQVIKCSYEKSEIIGKGNIKINTKLEIGSIHHTNYLSCIIHNKTVDNYKYDLLALTDEINPLSAKIIYLIFENKLHEANDLIKEIIFNKDFYSYEILLQILGPYKQYLYNKFNLRYIIDYIYSLDYDDKAINIEDVSIDINNIPVSDITNVYLKKLDDIRNIIHKNYDDIHLYELSRIISEDGLIKIYYLDTPVQLKKHSKRTIKQILTIDSQYIFWCILNLKHFAVSPMIIMALNTLDIEIDEGSFSVNLLKLQIKYFQDDVRDIHKRKMREKNEIYGNMLNDGIREAYNNDSSNLWNTD